MRKITYLLFFCLCTAGSITSFAQDKAATTAYGKKFADKEAINAEVLAKKMGEKTTLPNVVVAGEIAQVCQAEGCWLKLVNKDGAPIMVKFKDHAFLVPKDIAGKNVVVNGTAVKEVVSVAEQKHLAEDAGKTAAEIKKITQPKTELRIDATGVVVKS